MVPANTFHSWGSSSTEYRRSQPPTLVIRGSAFSLNSAPAPWSTRRNHRPAGTAFPAPCQRRQPARGRVLVGGDPDDPLAAAPDVPGQVGELSDHRDTGDRVGAVGPAVHRADGSPLPADVRDLAG